jgi:hypothetical protein
MDSILPAFLAAGILLLSSLLIGRSSFTSFQVLGDSWHEAEEQSIERVRSDIEITSISASGSDVDVTVQNTGATDIVDFSKMDVVLQYVGGSQNNIRYISFTTEGAPQPDNTWRVILVTNDVVDPGVLNQGESMTVRIKLNPAPDASSSHWVQITTELGISVASFFTT